jgi:hypothetical protein
METPKFAIVDAPVCCHDFRRWRNESVAFASMPSIAIAFPSGSDSNAATSSKLLSFRRLIPKGKTVLIRKSPDGKTSYLLTRSRTAPKA